MMTNRISPTPPSGYSKIQESTEIALNKVVDEFAAKNDFQGIVGVRSGNSIYIRCKGYATSSGNLHSPDTPFPICSISKTFTAAAILQLVDQNELSLKDPVSKFIKDPRGIF